MTPSIFKNYDSIVTLHNEFGMCDFKCEVTCPHSNHSFELDDLDSKGCFNHPFTSSPQIGFTAPINRWVKVNISCFLAACCLYSLDPSCLRSLGLKHRNTCSCNHKSSCFVFSKKLVLTMVEVQM